MIDAFTLGLLSRLPGLFHLYAKSRASPLSTPSVPTILTMQSNPFNHPTVPYPSELPAQISTFAYSSANLVCAPCSWHALAHHE
jgi:hypothetical protein